MGGLAFALGNSLGSLVPGHTLASAALFAWRGAQLTLSSKVRIRSSSRSRDSCASGWRSAFCMSKPRRSTSRSLPASSLFVFSVSLAGDLLRGGLRRSTAPTFREIVDGIEARETERLVFAASAAIAVTLAYAASASFELTRPYWALLALVLVLRLDFMSSWNLVIHRIAGTMCGVIVAGLFVVLFPSPAVQAGAMLVAALLRWPAQQRHNLLGVAALTAFVMLLVDLGAGSRQASASVPRCAAARHGHRLPFRPGCALPDLDGDAAHPQKRLAHGRRGWLIRQEQAPILGLLVLPQKPRTR